MDWNLHGKDWPHHECSRFVQAGGLTWHVQVFEGADPAPPVVLLLHGTGASTHSWRDVAPLLARRGHTVIAPDLPGHAFTGMPSGGVGAPQLSLKGMSRALQALLQTLQVQPTLVIGHSAGAAIAIRMAIDGLIAPRRIVGLNAAVLPLGGLAGPLFSPVAKLMAAAPLVPRLFAWRARDPAVLERLLGSTGSQLDATGIALYHRLVSHPAHAGGALAMMANWNLPQLARDLPRLKTTLDLLVGENDRTVPPAHGALILERVTPAARGRLVVLKGLGHLAHEEAPERIVELACP
ncbi:MAG: alpha/beta fold hydrolase BchO [Hydrogenophaga sp.]|uniref:alpha/beta fold hydrolase BchO n=1 Tax=Hydrogenophaga sp. TaxID=1904254 RepID=UPI003D0E36C5